MGQFTIATRVRVLAGVMSVLLLVVGLLGLSGIGQTNQSLKTVYEDRTVPLEDLGMLIDMINRVRTLAVVAANVNDPAVAKDNNTQTLALDGDVDKVWTKYMATYLTPEEKELAANFATQWKAYQISRDVTLKRAMDGDAEGAKQNTFQDAAPKFTQTRDTVFKLIQLQGRVAKQEYVASQERYTTARITMLSAMVLGFAFAAWFSWMLVSGIVRSLAQAMATAKAVAQGDLSQTIAVQGTDEIAELLHALSAMQSSLIKVVSTVRTGAEVVHSTTGEIAAGNTDLSARTESQAGALEQTAASMEQLSSAVKQNADSANEASQLARTASTVAIKGGEVVSQVVDTMKHINESSKRIADIIGVIDGIAFQTNILALNAAVEAARAGDQGRGFAVVASEVRSLAGRSAEAAKEIKTLIGVSVERVAQGTVLVDQAGATMSEVVDSIRRVTDLIGEISSASNEQSLGVAQVGEAVSHMDQATQQNAQLVEEMANAAGGLNAQSQELVQAVSVFNLGAQASAFATPHRASTARPKMSRANAPRASVSAPLRPSLAAAKSPSAAPARALSSSAAAVPKAPVAAKVSNEDWETF